MLKRPRNGIERLQGFLQKIGTVIPVLMLQNTVLFGTAKIVPRVMDLKEI